MTGAWYEVANSELASAALAKTPKPSSSSLSLSSSPSSSFLLSFFGLLFLAFFLADEKRRVVLLLVVVSSVAAGVVQHEGGRILGGIDADPLLPLKQLLSWIIAITGVASVTKYLLCKFFIVAVAAMTMLMLW